MEIVIRKSEVYKEVEKQSALLGSSWDGSGFEGLWATEHEGHFLDSYWIEGVVTAVSLFKRYIKADTVTHDLAAYDKDEILKIDAVMPLRFSEYLKGDITDSLKMMLASNVLYRWLLVKQPDISESYKVYTEDYARDLKQKLTYREEPLARVLSQATEDEHLSEESDENYRGLVEDEHLSEESVSSESFRNNIHDYIKFEQYERCNDCPQSRRNHG